MEHRINLGFEASPEKGLPSKEEKIESLSERSEILSGVFAEYEEIYPVLSSYFNETGVKYEDPIEREKIYNRNFSETMQALTKFQQHVEAIINLQTSQGFEVSGLNHIYGSVTGVIKNISEAPNVGFSIDDLKEKYGSKENVPAGTFSYEHTQSALRDFMSQMNGVRFALDYLKVEQSLK